MVTSAPWLIMVSLPSAVGVEGMVIIPPPLLNEISDPRIDIVCSSLIESLSLSPVLDIVPLEMSIPGPGSKLEAGNKTVSPIILSISLFPETVMCWSSFVVSLSASSTPSCKVDKFIEAGFPFSIFNVRVVPIKSGVNKFWSSEPPKEIKSVSMVPPASVISKIVPFKTTDVFNSLVFRLSASFTLSISTVLAWNA